MNGMPYVLIVLIILAVIWLVLVIRAKKSGKALESRGLTPIALILIVFAIVLSDKVISYSLIAIGIIIAFADIFVKSRKRI